MGDEKFQAGEQEQASLLATVESGDLRRPMGRGRHALKQPPGIYTSRAEIDRLLSGKPSRYQLICRANAVQRLAEDCARFYPIQTLHKSLLDDVDRLRRALES